MKLTCGIVGGIIGVVLGIAGTAFCIGPSVKRNLYTDFNDKIHAGSSDRFEDYVMCTGAVAINARAPTDGVWLLDYRAGKLLGTVIDRNAGKIMGWSEVNLTQDFNIPPKQNVHFMMTTGNIAQGQSALYVAETTTGKFAIYTLGPDPTGQVQGMTIRRHDMGLFRSAPVKN